MRWKDYDKFMEAIDFLLSCKNDIPPTKDIQKTEYAIIRCYEVIGGILKNWDREIQFNDPIITKSINMRDKMSRFYAGANWDSIKHSMKDVEKLRDKIERLQSLDKP